MATDLSSLMIIAMLMMQLMIWMEKTCKEVVFAWNLPETPVIAAGAAAVVAVEAASAVVEVAAAADLEAAMEAGPVATRLDQEPIIDWLWRICHLVLLGRI